MGRIMQNGTFSWFHIFAGGVYAGIFIGIAGTVFLMVPNPVAGALLFAFGLLTIVCFRFKLFTGAVGYLADRRGTEIFRYAGALCWIWLGNFTGCALAGFLVRHSRIFLLLEQRVSGLCAVKAADSAPGLLILAFFCGILMYVAVETFQREKLPGTVRCVMVFLCVTVFILSGFEHSIAGMYYFSVAGRIDAAALRCIGLMTLGNALGGMLIPLGKSARGEAA